MGRIMEGLLDDIPGGTVNQKLAQNEQRIDAVKSFMQDFGAGDAGYISDDVAKDFWNSRGVALTEATKLKHEVIDNLSEISQEPVYTGHTVDLIDAEMDRLSQLDNQEMQPLITKLANWREMIQGKDLSQIESHRRYLSNVYKDQSLGTLSEPAQSFANKVYASLRGDMDEYILMQGSDADMNQWKVAMKRLENMSKDFDDTALSTALNTGQGTPEAITRLLDKDVSTINKLYDRLTPEGRDRTASGIFANWIEQATDQGDISANKLSQLISDDLTSTTGKQKFASFFGGVEGEGYKAVEGLQKVIDLTAGAERKASGNVGARVAAVGAIPGLSYAAARFIAGGDHAEGVMAAGVGLLSAGKLAQALEGPTARNLAIQIANAPPKSAREMELVKRFLDIVDTIDISGTVEGAKDKLQGEIDTRMPEYMRSN